MKYLTMTPAILASLCSCNLANINAFCAPGHVRTIKRLRKCAHVDNVFRFSRRRRLRRRANTQFCCTWYWSALPALKLVNIKRKTLTAITASFDADANTSRQKTGACCYYDASRDFLQRCSRSKYSIAYDIFYYSIFNISKGEKWFLVVCNQTNLKICLFVNLETNLRLDQCII